MALSFFISSSIFLGFSFIIAAVFFWTFLPGNMNLWQRLPRERFMGIILGILCILWISANLSPVLVDNLKPLRIWLYPAMTILGISSFFFLDYLFARALGGICLLLADFFLYQAYVEQIYWRPLYSLILYGIGINGLILILYPYHFRDLLEKISIDKRCRIIVSYILLLIGVLMIVIPLLPKS